MARLIDQFERLPGIGPRTAQRLALHLLNQPEDDSIDDVVSIQRLDTNRLILTTYKKEILLNLTEEPFVEVID